jgi:hypothetical protein
MDLSPHIIGHYAAQKIRQRIATPVLHAGSDSFTRAELARCECFNFTACNNLDHALNHVLKVKNLREVFDTISPEAFALPHVGNVSFAVLGAAFEAKGLGGERPLATWVEKHMPKVVTFDSIKHREHAEAAREAKERKARKHERRNQAHKTRVDRFMNRAANG